MYRIAKLISALSIASLLLTACAPSTTPTQPTPTPQAQPEPQATGPVTIGAIAPLTGDAASYGVPLQRVTEYALKQLNEKGGVNDRELKIMWEDGKCNGKDASAAANKLVNIDKVKVILGGFCSSETLGAAPITEAAKVILFSPGSSSPKITEAGDFVFRNWPSDSSQGKLLANKANELSLKKVAFISEKQDYTLGILNAFKDSFSALGGETIVEEYLSEDADFKTQITKLKGQNPDALFINPQTPPKADLIIKQLQELDFKPKYVLLNDVATNYQELTSKYATYLEGALGADVGVNTEHPELKALQAWYKEKYAEELPYTSYSATEYDAVYILKEAMEAAGTDNTEGIRDYLYKINNRQGLGGSLSMDENGDPKSGHLLKTIKEGKAVTM